MAIRIVRLGSTRAKGEGPRLGTVRRPPRGVPKSEFAKRDYWLWGYGGTGRALAKALRAHDRHPAAIVELHPRRIGQRIQRAPVIRPSDLGAPGSLPLIVSVAGADARALIRAELAGRGFREGADYVCAA